MGLDSQGARFLLYAKSLNVDFSRTAVIGRQGLHLRPSDLRRILQRFAFPTAEETVRSIFLNSDGYAEEFLRYLGANETHSFDYSSYEGATHIHDMNQPIPGDLRGRYSMVLDGGSLEHVFNFPTALRNGMEMVRVGGHYLGITPTNNFTGHGFYQFSPELFFSAFTDANGYELISVIACEENPDPNAQWFAVRSPKQKNSRVGFVNSVPTYLFILAKRVSERAIFASIPQQSDYISTWKNPRWKDPSIGDESTAPDLLGSFRDFLRYRLPTPVKKGVRRLRYFLRPSFNPEFFEPLKF
jgi:hypothetical protein